MFFFLTLFTQVAWGYSALRGGLAYLPFVGGFIVVAAICSKMVPRLGARVPMTNRGRYRPRWVCSAAPPAFMRTATT